MKNSLEMTETINAPGTNETSGMHHLESWIRRNRKLLLRVMVHRSVRRRVDKKTAESLGIENQGGWVLLTSKGIARTNGAMLIPRERIDNLLGHVTANSPSEPVSAADAPAVYVLE